MIRNHYSEFGRQQKNNQIVLQFLDFYVIIYMKINLITKYILWQKAQTLFTKKLTPTYERGYFLCA